MSNVPAHGYAGGLQIQEQFAHMLLVGVLRVGVVDMYRLRRRKGVRQNPLLQTEVQLLKFRGGLVLPAQYIHQGRPVAAAVQIISKIILRGCDNHI